MVRQPQAEWPAGSSEMAQEIARGEWRSSSLGRSESWSQPLKILVDFIVASRSPMFIVAGQDFSLIYNDAFSSLLPEMDGGALLGRSFRDVFPDAGEEFESRFSALSAGCESRNHAVFLPA